MKKILTNIVDVVGLILSYIWPKCLFNASRYLYSIGFTAYKRRHFRHIGNRTVISPVGTSFLGEKYIIIKENTTISRYSEITAWSQYKGACYTPYIEIGSNCSIGESAHITSINKIIIGDNVLIGKRVLISDNSHGDTSKGTLLSSLPPSERILTSKGPTIICNNVWIGENCCILSGVTIGEGTVVAANSVVTKDVPAHCVAAGIPAKIIKHYE